MKDRAQVASLVNRVVREYAGVDVLMNVAGIITVGPLDAMTVDDFHDCMQTNCWGALHTVLEVLPHMRAARWGRIFNIASIGGKQAVPHPLPYVTNKFALVGLSNGLRAELKKENIFVTTACPSLMRTGSPRNATFKGQHRKEYAWFSISDSLPILSMSAQSAAIQMIDACRYGLGEVIVQNPLNLAQFLQRAFPELANEIMAIAFALLH